MYALKADSQTIGKGIISLMLKQLLRAVLCMQRARDVLRYTD